MLEKANFVVNVLAAFGAIAAVLVSLYLYWAAQRPDVIAYLSHDRDNGCVLFEVKNFDSVVSQVSLSYKRKGFFGPKTEKRCFPLDYYSFCGSIYKKSDLYKLRIAAEVIAGIRTKEQAKRA